MDTVPYGFTILKNILKDVRFQPVQVAKKYKNVEFRLQISTFL